MTNPTKPIGVIVALILSLSLTGNLYSQDEAKEAPAPAAEPAPAAAEPAPAAAEPTNSVVLTVDGTPITENDVREIMMARFGRQLQQMPPEQLAMVQQQMQQMVMGDLISKTLFLNAANKEGCKASQEEIDEKMKEIAANIPGGANLEEFAAQAGVDLNRIKSQVAEDIQIRHLFDKVTADIKEPEEAEVKTYYDENPEEFKQDESVTASHILFSTQGETDEGKLAATLKAAEELQAELNKEEGTTTFEDMATTHSDCPSKEQGGSLGEFSRGQMVPEFEKAAFTQEIGKVGAPVKTQFGYHLIKVTERKEAKELPYGEVKEELATNLFERKKSEKVESFLEELRSKAKIEQPGAPAPPQTPEPAVEEPEAEESLDI